jgi:hypothetical protein
VTTFPADPKNDGKQFVLDLPGPKAIENIANNLKSAGATASRGATDKRSCSRSMPTSTPEASGPPRSRLAARRTSASRGFPRTRRSGRHDRSRGASGRGAARRVEPVRGRRGVVVVAARVRPASSPETTRSRPTILRRDGLGRWRSATAGPGWTRTFEAGLIP